jgi:hypothetical protein
MNPGMPGTGIGGLFYIAGALWAPVDAMFLCATGRRTEVRWRLVARQSSIALGILAALWLAGWGLGYLLTSGAAVFVGMIGPGTLGADTVRFIRWAAILGSTGLLCMVLLSVQLLRITVRRPAPPRLPPALPTQPVYGARPPAVIPSVPADGPGEQPQPVQVA